ncbi:MAG: hypothetical protein V2A53_03205 [bacterium]
MFKKTLITMLAMLFLASQSFAARPLTTDDAGTVDKEGFEAEIGYDFAKNQDESQSQSIGVSLKRGITERLDFGIALPYEIEPNQGLGEAEVGVKFSLLKEKKNSPAVSLTFSSELGASEYALNTILTKEIGRLTAHLNLGYIATGKVDEKGVSTYSGAIELLLGERLVMVSEIVGEADADSNTKNPLEGLLGGRLQVSESLTFDLGIGIGGNDASPKWKTILGLTYGF